MSSADCQMQPLDLSVCRPRRRSSEDGSDLLNGGPETVGVNEDATPSVSPVHEVVAAGHISPPPTMIPPPASIPLLHALHHAAAASRRTRNPTTSSSEEDNLTIADERHHHHHSHHTKALSVVEAALGSLGSSVAPSSTPISSASSNEGPARKRFLTKYLHKDRGM